MKNIHVLPTEKPSRLAYDFYEKFYLLSEDTQFFEFQNLVQNRELYITNDEEIKQGDWCHTVGTSLFNSQIGRVTKKVIEDNGRYGIVFKKIILTTDQDLIKDGVQAISEEFLEWFVSKANDSGKPIDIVEVVNDIPYKPYPYEIIIPKEEQKQNLINMMQDDEELGLYDYGWCKGNVVLPNEENCCTPIGQIKRYVDCKGCDRKPNKLNLTQLSKNVDDALDKETKESMSQWLKEKREQQETLEEASWRFNPLKKLDGEFLRDAFVKGAKWQAERMYSEEEVLKLVLTSGKLPFANDEERIQWFEQFKKK